MERKLIKQAKAGDKDAFDKLMIRHQQTIFRLAYRMLDNRDDALDIVQETFYRAYRSLKKFRGDASFRLWLEKIATNLCISRYRRRKLFSEIEKAFGLGKSPQWDDEIDTDVNRKMLAIALSTLTTRERVAFILRLEQKLSTKQTAEIMGISEGTVKTLLHRANQKMKKALKHKLNH